MSECIEWHLSRNRDGYGQKKVQGKMRRAHRLAYVEHRGLNLEDIDGMVVMHLCDNPPCVNVHHLRLGTHADNIKDMCDKGRQRGGCPPVLDEYAVRWIRSYYATGDYTQQDLADQFGVTREAVSRITTRKNWRHI